MADKCIIEPERDCIGKAAALLLEKRIEDLEAWRDDSKKFHRDFYDWQRGQIARDARIDEQLSTMRKSLDKLVEQTEKCRNERIQEQRNENADNRKRKKDFAWQILLVVATAVVTYILARFGLG